VHQNGNNNQRRETPIWLKEKVLEIRKGTKLCALKLHWKLEKQGLEIHERTIGKILKTEGLVKKYRVKKVKYKYIKASLEPGELVEIDVKCVPKHIGGKRIFNIQPLIVLRGGDTSKHTMNR